MMTSSAQKPITYDEDPIARLTGLTLNPESPPQFNSYLNENNTTSPGKNSTEQSTTEPVENNPNAFTLRSLVTTKEAGIIIGKGGKNVAEVRELTGVKAGVSKVIQGVYERVLSITGELENVSKAYSIIAKHLVENPASTSPTSSFINNNNQGPNSSPTSTTIRLLVPHQLMGSVIGKSGSKIREIQEQSGAKIVISKDMLPQSTERVIEIYGLVDSIQIAVQYIGECVLGDLDRASGSIQYNPQVRLSNSQYQISRPPRSLSGPYNSSYHEGGERKKFSKPSYTNSQPDKNINTEDVETRNVLIPAGMVGCIIGRGGSFINDIRKMSGCKISISKITDPSTNQRTFSVTGTPENIEKALNMLYNQLDNEKERRLQQKSEEDE